MVTPEEFFWEFTAGRNEEDIPYESWDLIHASGRVVGYVECPVAKGRLYYRLVFYLNREMDQEDCRFRDLESAKAELLALIISYFESRSPVTVNRTASVTPKPTTCTVKELRGIKSE